MYIAVIKKEMIKNDPLSAFTIELCRGLVEQGNDVLLYTYKPELSDPLVPVVHVGLVNVRTIMACEVPFCKTLYYGRELKDYDHIIVVGGGVGLRPAVCVAKIWRMITWEPERVIRGLYAIFGYSYWRVQS